MWTYTDIHNKNKDVVMFINPKHAIDQGWIQGIRNYDKQVQPNAIDFTLDTLHEVVSTGSASVSETGKTMRQLRREYPLTSHYDAWLLSRGTVYDGTSEVYVEIPDGVVAVLYTRSTLARNGVFLMSGLFDTGYKGHIGFTVYPIGGDIEIRPGTRVGQIAFIQANAAGAYVGGWNHEMGTHYRSKETL
jgi:deoxycytidine triphosphate deaminase